MRVTGGNKGVSGIYMGQVNSFVFVEIAFGSVRILQAS